MQEVSVAAAAFAGAGSAAAAAPAEESPKPRSQRRRSAGDQQGKLRISEAPFVVYTVDQHTPAAPNSPKQFIFTYFGPQSRYYLYTWSPRVLDGPSRGPQGRDLQGRVERPKCERSGVYSPPCARDLIQALFNAWCLLGEGMLFNCLRHGVRALVRRERNRFVLWL